MRWRLPGNERAGAAALTEHERLGDRWAAVVERLAYRRDLVTEMVARDVRVKYKRSIFGIAWAMLNPLLYLLVFYFVFQIVLGLHTPRFTAFGLTGLLTWGWSAGSLSQAVDSITGNRELLRQPGFPAALLPPVAVGTHLVYFLFALPVLMLFLIADGSRPGLNLLTLPAVLAVQFLLTLALTYFVASLHAIFRDTAHLLDVFLRLMMFASPIFYAASRVPAAYQSVYRLNPFVPLLEAYRALLMHGTDPDWEHLAIVGVSSVVGLYLGARFYARTVRRAVDDL